MKRDLDEIRRILLECEGSADRWFSIGVVEEHEISGEHELRSPRKAVELFHIDLMGDAGLIRIEKVTHPGLGGPELYERMFELTWNGHDYLDAVRNDSVWEQTKAAVAKEGGSMALELVKALALGFARRKLEDHTGLKL